VQHHQDVFKHNERVNIFGTWHGDEHFFFMSFVGALNVGSIILDFDKDVVTNNAINPSPYMYDKSYSGQKLPLPVQTQPRNNKENSPAQHISPGIVNKENSIELLKGQMIGRFEMGSTIVLIWESNEGTEVKVAEG